MPFISIINALRQICNLLLTIRENLNSMSFIVQEDIQGQRDFLKNALTSISHQLKWRQQSKENPNTPGFYKYLQDLKVF